MSLMQHSIISTGLSIIFSLLISYSLLGQNEEGSKKSFFGSPELKFEPTLTIENFINAPRILSQSNTSSPLTEQMDSETLFELIFAFGIPTAIPRVDLTFETMWKPFAETDKNLFTGATSENLGNKVKDNFPEIEAELNFSLFTFDQTNGWVDAHFDVVDKFSPAKRPEDKSSYTHKLNFELDIAFGIFQWIKEESWLSELEFEVSLDYLATGIPQKGDVFKELDIEYLENASPWAVSLLMVFPIAPLKLGN